MVFSFQGVQLDSSQAERLGALACAVRAKDDARAKVLLNDRDGKQTDTQEKKSWDFVAVVRGQKIPLKLSKVEGGFVATTEDGREIR